MRRISLDGCRLYVIVDRSVLGGRDPGQVAEQAIRGGADLIQWRDKAAGEGEFLQAARELRRVTRRWGRPLIVNDRVDVALSVRADGVHLGHEDLPVRVARSLVGKGMWIGRSTHSLQEARRQEREGADYLGVGPIFQTPTKPDERAVGLKLVRQVCRAVRIPWFAIGGIDRETAPLVLSAGAVRVAVVRAVAGRSEPREAARSLKEIILQTASKAGERR